MDTFSCLAAGWWNNGSFLSRAERNCFIAGERRLES